MQNGRVSIQITRTYARIASAANSKTVYFTLDEDEEVKFAMSVNERFIFLTNGGMLMVYVWDNREETIQEINTSGINFPDNGILGASLYLDRSGLFTNVKPANVGSIDMAAEPDILEVTTRAEAVPEDEDELLYGPRGAAADSSKEKQGWCEQCMSSRLYACWDRVRLCGAVTRLSRVDRYQTHATVAVRGACYFLITSFLLLGNLS